MTNRVVNGIIYLVCERVVKMDGVLTPMTWIRFTKVKEKEINFFELDWHTKREAVAAKVVRDGITHTLILMDKYPFNTFHLYSISNLRIPIVINRANSIYNMAMSVMLYNNRVTEKNAKNELFNSMGKDEMLIDWSKGFVYWRVGRSSTKRFKIEEYYITDKKKLINWHYTTRENDIDDEQEN